MMTEILCFFAGMAVSALIATEILRQRYAEVGSDLEEMQSELNRLRSELKRLERDSQMSAISLERKGRRCFTI